MISTSIGVSVNSQVFSNYFSSLVDSIFKILPIWEDGEEKTLDTYIKSLEKELLGCEELIKAIDYDGMIVSLVSVLENLSNHIYDEDMTQVVVKREVFKAISISKKICSKYFKKEEEV